MDLDAVVDLVEESPEMECEDKDKEYELPGTEDSVVIKYRLDRLNQPQLLALHRDLGFGTKGKKEDFLRKLKDYSTKPEEWKLQRPGARRSHKGPQPEKDHNGEKKSKKKTGYKARREELIKDQPLESVQRSHDTCLLKTKQELLEWAGDCPAVSHKTNDPRAV
ncbi:hypothetical protein Moror_2194 [Moniliophthora roreri MCA 2997]|uniref:SAP domain-containing protein n=1 Tax=Moniliophthora roreri (strain MCA 2997) TaxID=1381753 RepID=V2W3V6_MONRO|nr:hypothetical protein Moror_2194 [Moniliophthora roreri MCA 2997]